MNKYVVEVAVGYRYGSWETETVEIDEPPMIGTMRESEVEEYLLDKAEDKIEENLGYNLDVSFYHLMYSNLKEEEG